MRLTNQFRFVFLRSSCSCCVLVVDWCLLSRYFFSMLAGRLLLIQGACCLLLSLLVEEREKEYRFIPYAHDKNTLYSRWCDFLVVVIRRFSVWNSQNVRHNQRNKLFSIHSFYHLQIWSIYKLWILHLLTRLACLAVFRFGMVPATGTRYTLHTVYCTSILYRFIELKSYRY